MLCPSRAQAIQFSVGVSRNIPLVHPGGHVGHCGFVVSGTGGHRAKHCASWEVVVPERGCVVLARTVTGAVSVIVDVSVFAGVAAACNDVISVGVTAAAAVFW